MNVFNNPHVQKLTRVFKTDNEPATKAPSSQETQKTSRGDSVDLSSEGKILAAIKQRLSEVPEIRADKVASLRQAIESGTYQVPSEEIAERMLQEGKLP